MQELLTQKQQAEHDDIAVLPFFIFSLPKPTPERAHSVTPPHVALKNKALQEIANRPSFQLSVGVDGQLTVPLNINYNLRGLLA